MYRLAATDRRISRRYYHYSNRS